MSDSLTTKVDRSYLDDATRADAHRYLTRTGNADVAVILGLVDEPDPNPLPAFCPACRKPVPSSGVCRRGRQCRVETARLLGREEPDGEP